MIGLLKAKLALLIHTKVGVAVVAAALVAGGGSAVAATVTHGNFNEIGSALVAAPSGTHTGGADTSGGDAANHESLEGTLAAYDATAGTISVQPATGTPKAFGVTSTTKVNGAHANTLSDLTAAVGHKVQVQADKSGTTWVASKVTVEAAESAGNGDGKGEGQGEQAVFGKIKSVSGASFIVTSAKGDITVTVDGSTHFSGHVASVSDLKQGMGVEVQGTTQTDGTVLARTVTAQSSDGEGGDGGGAGDGGHAATPAASATATDTHD